MLDRIAPQRNTKTAGERDGDPSRTEYCGVAKGWMSSHRPVQERFARSHHTASTRDTASTRAPLSPVEIEDL
jgi:hypothetical protein